MEFSHRMANLPPYLFADIENKIQAKKKAGFDVISLGIGDPDLPTPAYIVEEMTRQVARPENHGYPTNAGLPEFAEAAALFYKKRFGVDIDPEHEFLPLLGGKEGLAHIFWSTLDAGDLALIPDPGYPVYAAGCILTGAEARYMPLRPENDFLPDLDSITPDEARRAKLLIVSYPNNPTSGIVEGDFFERLVAFAKAYDIAVVHDNAYSELTFDGYVAPSFLETPGAKDIGVEFFSFSKPFNMTGWRLAFAVGNAEILEYLWRLKTNVDSGMFQAIQRVGAFILNSPMDSLAELNEIYRRRRDLMCEALEAIGLRPNKPKATIYLWVPIPEGYTSNSFATLMLDKASVAVAPGTGYGPSGEGFIRISLTCPDDRLQEAAIRIEKSLS